MRSSSGIPSGGESLGINPQGADRRAGRTNGIFLLRWPTVIGGSFEKTHCQTKLSVPLHL